MTALDIYYVIPHVADDLCQMEYRAHAMEGIPPDWMESNCTVPEHLHERCIRPANESDCGTPGDEPRKEVAQEFLAAAPPPCIIDKEDFQYRTPLSDRY